MQILYCARRDKSAVEIVGTMSSESKQSHPAIFICKKENMLNLPEKIQFDIQRYYHPKKMLWELFIQNFVNYDDFYKNLSARGYKGIQNSSRPIIFNSNKQLTEIKQIKQKVMLRKNNT